MSEIDDEKSEPGTVLQEVQSGYMLGERLLRPALVTVSKKKTTKDQENMDNKGKNRVVDKKIAPIYKLT